MFHLGTTERAKRVAHDLKNTARTAGITLTLARAFELTARMYQYRDWYDLVTNHAGDAPSKDDTEVTTSLADSRRSHHVAVLVEAGFDPTAANMVAATIRPTGRSGQPAVPKAVSGLSLLPDTTAGAWKQAIGRRDGICFLATQEPIDRSPAFLHTVTELLTQGRSVGRPTHSFSFPYPEALKGKIEESSEDADVMVMAHSGHSEQGLAHMLSVAAAGKLVLAPMMASSVGHAAAIISSITEKNAQVLRHVMRGILAECRLRTCSPDRETSGYSGETHVSEAWPCSDVSGADNLLHNGPHYEPLLRSPGKISNCEWMPMHYMAMDLVDDGTTDIEELKRVFGSNAVDGILYNRARKAA